MNRSDKARAIIVFEELAAALRVELFSEAATEHAEGSTPSWRMGDVTVSSSLSNPSVVIEDHAEFLAYVQRNHPTEVETITPAPVTQIRPHFQKALLAGLAKNGEPLCDSEGQIIPGVKYQAGGVLRSIAVKPTPGFKDDAVRFALEVAAGQRPFALPSVTPADAEEPLIGYVVEEAAPSAAPVASLFDDPWADFGNFPSSSAV